MLFKITLRHTATNKIKVVFNEHSDLDSAEFWWEEGNGGCDCNRLAYFLEDYKTSFDCNVGENVIELINIEQV